MNVRTEEMSPEEIIVLLDLKPHPTCGHAVVTHEVFARDTRGLETLQASSGFAAVLYFLVTRDAQLRLHRIPIAQMYHHYGGSALDVLLLYADGRAEVATVGSDLAAGMRPQLLVPAQTWHISRLPGDADFALMGTASWGTLGPDEYELGDVDLLADENAAHREWLREFV